MRSGEFSASEREKAFGVGVNWCGRRYRSGCELLLSGVLVLVEAQRSSTDPSTPNSTQYAALVANTAWRMEVRASNTRPSTQPKDFA